MSGAWSAPSRVLFYGACGASVVTATIVGCVISMAHGPAGFPIFKEKGVQAVCVHLCAGLCWLWASVVVDGHAPPSWRRCVLLHAHHKHPR
jgi:hypothetical protein